MGSYGLLARRAVETDMPIMVKIQQLVRGAQNAVSLAQGVVHWQPPKEALDKVKELVWEPSISRYGADEGLPELREALVQKLRRENKLCKSSVMVTAGANQAFVNLALTLCDAGDSVVMFAPYYFNAYMSFQMTGVTNILVGPGHPKTLYPDADWLEKTLSETKPTPKLVTVVNPGNPSGTYIPDSLLKRISDICRGAGSWLVVDNTYEYFMYGDLKHTCVEGNHIVNIFSFSKAYGMMGWRVGYIAYPSEVEGFGTQLLKVQDNIPICASIISQHLALYSLEMGPEWVIERVKSLVKNRDIAAMVIFLLVLPIAVVIIEEFKILEGKKLALNGSSDLKIVTEKPKSEEESVPSDMSRPREALATTTTETEPSCWKTMFRPPDRGEDYTILQALFSIDMLILFISCICGVGGTLTAIDNLGQIGASLGYPKQSISTFVSLVSIWNYLGRVVSGFGSEILLKRYKFPRPLMLTLTILLSCVGHLLVAFNVKNGLYLASVIIGFCFGAQWPLLFAIISELFGLKYYSTLYNFGSSASPVGLYLLNVRLTGHVYDKEAKKQLAAKGLVRQAGKELTCVGGECFKLSFIVIAAATLFGTFVSLILVMRTRKFYQSDIYKKFRQETEAAEREMATVDQNGAKPLETNGRS